MLDKLISKALHILELTAIAVVLATLVASVVIVMWR